MYYILVNYTFMIIFVQQFLCTTFMYTQLRVYSSGFTMMNIFSNELLFNLSRPTLDPCIRESCFFTTIKITLVMINDLPPNFCSRLKVLPKICKLIF